MDWEQVLAYVIESVCGLIVSIGIPMAISYLKKKANNEYVSQLLDRASQVVTNCVVMTNQTYVDALKKEGKFGKEEQEAAFLTCKNNILSMLNEEAKQAIIDTFGSLDSWLNVAVEASVNIMKE